MASLFWVIWVINFLLLVIAVAGKGFRSGFGAGVDLNVLFIVILLAILAGSLVLRFAFKQKLLSLVVVSLPVLSMLGMYLFEKISGKSI